MEHVPQSELKREIDSWMGLIEVGAEYYHYKNPDKTYTVTGFGVDEATDQIMVKYVANYDEHIEFFRKPALFVSPVEYNDQIVPRFTKVG